MDITATPIITTKPLPLSGVSHISTVSSDKAWVSSRNGEIILIDKAGKEYKRVKCAHGHGVHAAAENGSLLFINPNGHISKISSDVSATPLEFIKIDNGKAICIHFSRLNGDILVVVKSTASHPKVVQYTMTGDVKVGEKTDAQYEEPLYITENVDSNICVSDGHKCAVMVVDKSGKHQFSYDVSPSGKKLSPSGICTDKEGRILMYDTDSQCIHIINKNGKHLCFLRGHDKRDIAAPAMCIDDKWNLWTVDSANKLIIYTYRETEDGCWMSDYGQT